MRCGESLTAARQVYSNWPTFPQLYAGGKLLGGLDVVREMAEDGSLLATVGGVLQLASMLVLHSSWPPLYCLA